MAARPADTRGPPGIASVPTGTATPAAFSPPKTGGRVLPTDTARMGSVPVTSSHRPIQPVATPASGTPVCQMSIDRKWLRLGFG